MFGSDGLYYGNEFELDSFDDHVNHVLLARYGQQDSTNDPNSPRIAIDIGCGAEAFRAFTLAQLGLFDEVFACDQGDRKNEVRIKNASLSIITPEGQKPFRPIRFVESNVLDLNLSLFRGKRAKFINGRRWPHFLPPKHFREALKIIRTLADSEAVIAISFDFSKEKELTTRHESSILSREDNVEAFYASRATLGDAPHTTYAGSDVISYMKHLGFTIDQEAPYRSADDLRPQEFHILAYAPKL